MTKRKTYQNRRPDIVADELTATLLEKPSFEFNDLFTEVFERLRARQAGSAGEEMLRLRVYEKLQNLVSQGLVKKVVKTYSAVRPALLARSAETVPAQTKAEVARRAILHVE